MTSENAPIPQNKKELIHPVIYPGSFDPVTNGHLDVIKRSLELFGKVTLAIGKNIRKTPLFSIEERLLILRKMVCDCGWTEDAVSVVAFSGMLSDFMKENQTQVVVRGLRDMTDFESEMRNMQFNRTLYADFETVFLPSREKYLFVSSTLIREMAALGADISALVPDVVLRVLQEKKIH